MSKAQWAKIKASMSLGVHLASGSNPIGGSRNLQAAEEKT